MKKAVALTAGSLFANKAAARDADDSKHLRAIPTMLIASTNLR